MDEREITTNETKILTKKLVKMLKMNKLKTIMTLVVLIAIAVACFAVYTWFTAEKSTASGAVMAQRVIKDLQLNTLTYYYTDSIAITEPEEWKLFGLIDLDPGIRFLIVQYDGIIRLGIDMGVDAENLQISERGEDGTGKRILEIKLPEATEISHEQFRNEEITVFQGGEYTNKEVSRELLNESYGNRKASFSEKARSLGLYDEAMENAKSQIENLLMMVPAIAEDYVIKWS
jgi:hypothetical protein